MTDKAPILTAEQWQHVKANDDSKTQAAISTSRAQEAALNANAEFLKNQVAPLSHRDAIAVHAMQGILSNPNFREILRDDCRFYERLVEVSFSAADAMLKLAENDR